ncbi:hypothetical protein ICY_03753 [Bacillus cereus BAG2X1-3]|nr:hypothetical protein ICU_03900 [Bacillus cereus BAG2X1-1]EJS73967.1 hypothetical protein ICY_03753 [Bacillus cereus BAG2X1-3]
MVSFLYGVLTHAHQLKNLEFPPKNMSFSLQVITKFRFWGSFIFLA